MSRDLIRPVMNSSLEEKVKVSSNSPTSVGLLVLTESIQIAN